MFGGKAGLVIDKKNPGSLARTTENNVKKMNMLGQMAFGMVHDIGNSLQILRASSFMIRKRSSDEALTKNVDAIDAVVENMAQMVERVLSFSNKSDNLISEIDLRTSLDEIITLSEYLIPPHITIDYHKPDETMMLMGNSLELSQALLNLIKNAADAIGPMSEKGLISIAVRECFPWVELKIRDNGCGIAPDQIEKVFDPLFTTKDDGTGIGLANVWVTVESHGGIISVNSELGKGTEFTIMLPKKNHE